MKDRERTAVAHRPVMLTEVIEALAIKPDGCYVDATFGRGGHASAILGQLGPTGRLLVIDKDPAAIAYAEQLMAADARVSIRHGSFAECERVGKELAMMGKVDGLLLDLGVSSPQLDEVQRGFSFRTDGPLDMRMDTTRGQTAAEWIACVKEEDLANVIFQFGEEKFSRRIARAIVTARVEQPIVTTGQLAALVATAVPTRERGKDPATRTFQAIRMFINNELADLQVGLLGALRMLAPAGRLVVLSFHSLEDRIVKHFIRDQERGPQLPKGLPVRHQIQIGVLRHIGKAQKAGPDEVATNVRARSAMLRAAERTATPLGGI